MATLSIPSIKLPLYQDMYYSDVKWMQRINKRQQAILKERKQLEKTKPNLTWESAWLDAHLDQEVDEDYIFDETLEFTIYMLERF